MNDGKVAYSPAEAAVATGLTRSRIYELIGKGELESFVDGRRRLISRRALDALVAKREAEASIARKVAA